MMVRGDLQQFRGIREAVNLVENESPAGAGREKRLGVSEKRPRPGQFAIEEVGIGQ